MSTETVTLHGDYETDDYGTYYHVRETDHGVYRAVVERDEYPSEPYFDFGCPIVSIDWEGAFSPTVEMVSGSDSAKHDGLANDMDEIIRHLWNETGLSMSSVLDFVNRWLKAFHGGSLIEFTSSIHRSSPTYIAYDTRAMREHWGQTGERLDTSDPDATEWQAYIDGDVYSVNVEQATFGDDGEIDGWNEVGDGPCWGHYGDDWAAQAALDELDNTILWKSRDMLPLASA